MYKYNEKVRTMLTWCVICHFPLERQWRALCQCRRSVWGIIIMRSIMLSIFKRKWIKFFFFYMIKVGNSWVCDAENPTGIAETATRSSEESISENVIILTGSQNHYSPPLWCQSKRMSPFHKDVTYRKWRQSPHCFSGECDSTGGQSGNVPSLCSISIEQ